MTSPSIVSDTEAWIDEAEKGLEGVGLPEQITVSSDEFVELLRLARIGMKAEKGEAQSELDKLVTYFRGDGFNRFGREGDYEGWTAAETAVKAMRKLDALLATPLPVSGSGALKALEQIELLCLDEDTSAAEIVETIYGIATRASGDKK